MALATFRHRSFHRFASWLLVLSLLLPAILPALHHPGAFGQAMSTICHTDLGGHGSSSDHGKAQPTCPVCQTLAGLASGFVPPEIPAYVPPRAVPIVFAASAVTVPVSNQTAAAWPRGPPSFA